MINKLTRIMDLPLTIKETQEGLKKKKFSAVDLVDAYLARIKSNNKQLNVFLTITEDEAYKKAKEVDKKITDLGEEAFKQNPLLGVVNTLKDLYLTKDIRTTAASKVLEGYVPGYSGTVVKKLEEAGTIMIGKTNCDAWAHGSSGENSDFGPTKNPWNKDFVPGGSSSGSAAALASGMSLISMGTDTGGSTRQPANFCSLVGLKPTYGAISRYGVIAMASSVDTIGSFGHTIEDIELMFDVLRGEDGLDSTVKDFTPKRYEGKKKLGIAKEFFSEGLDSEVKKTIDETVKVYKKIGIDVVEISLPHTKYAIPTYYIIQPAEVSSNLARYDNVRFGGSRKDFGDETKRRIMLGTHVLSTGYYDAFYLKAQKVRSKMIEDFDKAFEEVDAIVSPVAPTPPFKLGKNTSDPLTMYLEDIYTVSVNLTGLPGLALPSGFSKKGLPLGFQLIGPRFSEHNLFELGKKYHKEIDYKPKIAI